MGYKEIDNFTQLNKTNIYITYFVDIHLLNNISVPVIILLPLIQADLFLGKGCKYWEKQRSNSP